MELEQRLGLYQVFLKLYEHDHGLLDEILNLENTGNKFFSGTAPKYVQGYVQGQHIYLLTNLIEDRTQMLIQHQRIWTLGRARRVALPIPDRRLSRRHAVIQYIDDQGFYLIDLNSTNGSFVNGEPIYQPVLLKDGDRIRLSSLAFSFFVCNSFQTVDNVSPELLTSLQTMTSTTFEKSELSPSDMQLSSSCPTQEGDISRYSTDPSVSDQPLDIQSTPQLSPAQRSEILDRFFHRQILDEGGEN